jgi:hypothetical protein
MKSGMDVFFKAEVPAHLIETSHTTDTKDSKICRALSSMSSQKSPEGGYLL